MSTRDKSKSINEETQVGDVSPSPHCEERFDFEHPEKGDYDEAPIGD